MTRRLATVVLAVLAVTGISSVPAAAAPADSPTQEMRSALSRIPNAGNIGCWFNQRLISHANGKFVSMRVEEAGRIVANADSPGPWESFTVCRASNGATFFYSPTARRWVSVRLDESGIVRANGAEPGPWEIIYTSGNPDLAGERNTTVLHANANNSYASVRLEDAGRMWTGYKQIGPWEVYSW